MLVQPFGRDNVLDDLVSGLAFSGKIIHAATKAAPILLACIMAAYLVGPLTLLAWQR